MNYLRCLWTAAAGLLMSFAASGTDQSTFPRLAGINIGGPHDYENSTYQAQLAGYDMAVLGRWVGWEDGRNTTFEAVVKKIKSMNPNIKIFIYLNNNELQYPTISAAKLALQQKATQMKWWLYNQGTGPDMVLSGWGTNFYSTNLSLFAPRDSNGERWVEWYARTAKETLYAPNPSIDGFFLDNVFWKPRVNGDWNRDGVIDYQSNTTVQSWYRQGVRRHFDVLKQLMPGKYQIGNVAWNGAPSSMPELDNQLHGALVENLIGPSYATETWGGWAPMMERYRSVRRRLADPKMLMFNQWGKPYDYQGMRYGFASCLMDDGYYAFSVWPDGKDYAPYRDVAWFDEFKVELGKPTSLPATAAWSQGVYRRDFENGIALVNPKGNGPRTVQLETEFRRIAGTQDSAVNNGQLTRTVTLKDRDGIILLRKQIAKRPAPPGNVTVQ